MSSETEESRAVVHVAVDMEMANGGAADDAGNGNGGAADPQAVEAGQEDDGKVMAPEVVKEGEKKEGRKQMDSRSEMWKHYTKIFVDGVLQKGKCNYCKTDIAAHTVINGTSALQKHFHVCKRNPHKNSGDDKQYVLQVSNGDSVHAWNFDPEALRNSFAKMIFISAALDPRYKLSEYTQFSIMEMCGDDKGPKVWAAINNCLRDLFEEYRVMYGPNLASTQASFSLEAESSGGRARMMKLLIAKKMRLNNGGSSSSSSSSKSELDKFLAEEPEDDGPIFDILAWWKVNSSRFPTLACLARDVYAIPISTVASESAFSTGGRVLDDFRTSLTPFMVEALCGLKIGFDTLLLST